MTVYIDRFGFAKTREGKILAGSCACDCHPGGDVPDPGGGTEICIEFNRMSVGMGSMIGMWRSSANLDFYDVNCNAVPPDGIWSGSSRMTERGQFSSSMSISFLGTGLVAHRRVVVDSAPTSNTTISEQISRSATLEFQLRNGRIDGLGSDEVCVGCCAIRIAWICSPDWSTPPTIPTDYDAASSKHGWIDCDYRLPWPSGVTWERNPNFVPQCGISFSVWNNDVSIRFERGRGHTEPIYGGSYLRVYGEDCSGSILVYLPNWGSQS